MSEQQRTVGGRYVLLGSLGEGGTASVHRARDEVLSREVAVKVLREDADDQSAAARFTGEVRTLAGLTHPHLVTVLDAGPAASGTGRPTEQPFLVMELVEGPSLARRLAEGGPLEPGEVAELGRALAAALAYAHGRGVVHRDVKPGNVLLGTRVKLADFGIARIIGDTVHHTRTGQTIGTAAYLAPEQVLGEQVGPAADVYSLGLVLLESLTGTREYPGAPMEAAVARLHRDPAPPPELPAGWAALLDAMTAREPADRPDAVEVGRRLAALDSDEAGRTAVLTAPVAAESAPAAGLVAGRAAGRAGLLARAAAWWRGLPPDRRGLVLALAALVAFLLIAGIAAAFAGGGEPDAPDDGPSSPTSASSEPPASRSPSTAAPSTAAPTTPAPTTAAPTTAAPTPIPQETTAPPAPSGPQPGKGPKGDKPPKEPKPPKDKGKSKGKGKGKP